MRIFITGATGFIGRALTSRLLADGHSVTAWARSGTSARRVLGDDVEVALAGHDSLTAAVGRSDAVVNLAGAPLMSGRWTAARRAILEQSRITLTGNIVRAIADTSPRPRVLVSGSAVGYYGDRADERLTEASTAGDDFLARLCREWEEAAQQAETLGVRVVRLRTGVVLGRGGGALARMLPPFKLGLGGPVGAGTQYLPWIHLDDLVSIVVSALEDARFRGAVNVVAPEQATSRAFGRALGRALHRPAVLPLPGLALKLIFGEAASVLLASQRVEPRALQQLQFAFGFPTLDAALADLVGKPSSAGASKAVTL